MDRKSVTQYNRFVPRTRGRLQTAIGRQGNISEARINLEPQDNTKLIDIRKISHKIAVLEVPDRGFICT